VAPVVDLILSPHDHILNIGFQISFIILFAFAGLAQAAETNSWFPGALGLRIA